MGIEFSDREEKTENNRWQWMITVIRKTEEGERQKEGKINRWRGKQTEKGEERERRNREAGKESDR